MTQDLKNIYKFGFWIPLIFIAVIILKIIFFQQYNIKPQPQTNSSINEATSTYFFEPNAYQSEDKDVIPIPTEKQGQNNSLNRCTNDIYSFSILYSNEVIPILNSETDRCMNYLFVADVKDQENIAIKLRIDESNINELVDGIVSSLSDTKIEDLETSNGYQVKMIEGTWPAESINSGIKYFSIVVENKYKYVLVIEAKRELTQDEVTNLKELVKTITFL